MKFEHIASVNEESSPRDLLHRCRIKTETLHIEPWYEAGVSENRLMRDIDSLFDLTSIDRGEDGRLYATDRCFLGDEHFGEYSMWVEVEEIEEAL